MKRLGRPNPKNMMESINALNLGDQLKLQVEEAAALRKKKITEMQNMNALTGSMSAAEMLLGPAASMGSGDI